MFRERVAPGFEHFYRQHQASVLREALRLTGNEAAAWDLSQDTFERAFRAYQSFQPGTNGRGWLLTILTRLFIDDWRRQRSRGVHGRLDDLQVAEPNSEETTPPWKELGQEDVRAALDRLPAEARDLFEQHAFRRVSYARLSRLFQVPMATVGTRLHRTRSKLRTALMKRAVAKPARLAA